MFALPLALLAFSGPVLKDDAACSMTDTGSGNLWKVEMYSVNPSQPYKSIHCRFQGNDKLVTFNGTDSKGDSQCDSCVRSSDFSGRTSYVAGWGITQTKFIRVSRATTC